MSGFFLRHRVDNSCAFHVTSTILSATEALKNDEWEDNLEV